MTIQISNLSIELTQEVDFRELEQQESDLVVGGDWVRFAGAAGAVWTAFQGGWDAGQWLNENTPIQEWIASGLEAGLNGQIPQ
jgi:hypothetical protein